MIELVSSQAALLAAAAFIAGTVRGFAGFGTALIYIPLASIVLDPIPAIATMIVMDIVGPLPMLPKAARHVDRGDLARLVLGAALALPVGLATLFLLDPDVFRVIVSIVSLGMLTGLVLGWRYTGTLGRGPVIGTGAACGFLGGVAGIPGPPVIFVYMASALPPAVIRANITFFLFGYDWLVVAMLAVAGRLESGLVLTGLALIVPNMLGTFLGTALFVPRHERMYRWAAYALILAAALASLPVW